MLHTNFQGHQPFDSGEEDFLKFIPYMGMAANLVMWPVPVEQTFVPPSHGGSIWNLTLISPVVSEEKMFENVDIHTHIHTYGRQRPTYPISSPLSLRLRGAKKTKATGTKETPSVNDIVTILWIVGTISGVRRKIVRLVLAVANNLTIKSSRGEVFEHVQKPAAAIKNRR